MTKRFLNKIVIVTGSSQGIGKVIASSFAMEGAKVIMCGIHKQRGDEVAKKLNESNCSAQYLYCDLSKKGAPKRLIDVAMQKYKKIDVLVNNARAGKRKSMDIETEMDFYENMSVTLNAAYFCSKYAIEGMKKNKCGAIVNISSIAGFVVGHDAPAYHLAKSAMIHMTRYTAASAGSFGIRVNCVAPGFIVTDEYKTRFWSKENKKFRDIAQFEHPLKHTGTSKDIASAVLFFASDEASFVTGQTLVVDGGLTIQDQNNIIFRFSQSDICK